MSFHRGVLPTTQQQALRVSGPVLTAPGFYVAGGTAVALHLGHRRSIDLDWFRERPIEDPLDLAADLRQAGVEVAPNQWTVRSPDRPQPST